ncbi:MAG TPA: trehalase-like domain-containing protein, partial [Puia sp.]|nr:trehalase-like domain-containing protein [Puia sp.]
MSYQPIENYGIIGDLNTTALVGLNGSIDFMCFPRFDSPSIFAALLDDRKGGSYRISPVFKEMKTKQLYLPDTNVLLTRFLSSEGVAEVVDFMPVDPNGEKRLIRRVTTIRGEVKFQLQCCPRFEYAKKPHKVVPASAQEINFQVDNGPDLSLRLKASVSLSTANADAGAEFTLRAGESAAFLLESAANEDARDQDLMEMVAASLARTINYWKDWMS